MCELKIMKFDEKLIKKTAPGDNLSVAIIGPLSVHNCCHYFLMWIWSSLALKFNFNLSFMVRIAYTWKATIIGHAATNVL